MSEDPGPNKNYLSKFIDTIKSYINSSTNTSIQTRAENEMLLQKKLKRFLSLDASGVMIPRSEIIAVQDGIEMQDLINLYCTEQHSRIPVYTDSVDSINGFIHIKDLFSLIVSNKPLKIKKILRKMIYVPETLGLLDLLEKMKESKIHIAIVLDEYGMTSGLITVEDIVEQFFGDIQDEYDITDSLQYSKISDTEYEFEAKAKISDVEKIINLEFFNEQEVEYDTLAGLALDYFGYIPKAYEKITSLQKIDLEILESSSRAIKKIKLTIK